MKLALITLAIYAAGAAARDRAGSMAYFHPSHRAGGKIRNVCDNIRINKVARTKCGIDTPPMAIIMLALSIHPCCSCDMAEMIPATVPISSDMINASRPNSMDAGSVSVITLLTVLPVYLYDGHRSPFSRFQRYNIYCSDKDLSRLYFCSILALISGGSCFSSSNGPPGTMCMIINVMVATAHKTGMPQRILFKINLNISPDL